MVIVMNVVQAKGFAGFELLKRDRDREYIVLTRWENEDAFKAGSAAISSSAATAAASPPGNGIKRWWRWWPVARNRTMEEALNGVLEQVGRPDAEVRIAKRLAGYDYRSLRRLERTRILVRMGPALGLMGTLIPLSPALAGLADGDVATLTDNLRVAFSVTVAASWSARSPSPSRWSATASTPRTTPTSSTSPPASPSRQATAYPQTQHSHWAVAP